MNNIDDYPVIPNFYEQMATFDRIAKDMGPTRNKGNVSSFMERIEYTFKEKGWSFTDYCKKIQIDSYERRQKAKPSANSQVKAPENPFNELDSGVEKPA